MLDALGIHYERFEHPAVFTADDAAATGGRFAAPRVRTCSCATRKATAITS